MENEAFDPAGLGRGAPADMRRTRSHYQTKLDTATDVSSQAERGRQHGGDWEPAGRNPDQKTRKAPRTSVLAGLTGPERGMGRVREWSHHVEPGVPEADGPV
jgi:hypothetical protein